MLSRAYLVAVSAYHVTVASLSRQPQGPITFAHQSLVLVFSHPLVDYFRSFFFVYFLVSFGGLKESSYLCSHYGDEAYDSIQQAAS